MKNSLKLLINEILSKYKLKFVYLFFLLLFESFILASSVLTLVPLADYIIDPNLENPSKITKFIIYLLSLIKIKPGYAIFAAMFVVTNIMRSFFAIFIKHSILKIKYSIIKSLTVGLYQDIFSAKWNFFSNLGQGKLLNTLREELTKTGDATGQIALIFAMSVQFITYLIIPFTINFKFTFYSLVIAFFLGIPFLLLNGLSHKLGKLNTSTGNKITSAMNETIQAAKIILGFGNSKKAISQNVNALDDHIDVTIKSQIVSFIPNFFFRPVALLAVIISLAISIDVDKNISEYAAIFWSLWAIIPVLSSIISSTVIANNLLPSYEQLQSLRKKAALNIEISGDKKFDSLNDKIFFKNVSFNYPNKKDLVKNCSFEIKKNQITTIVGKSGSGKSTIIDLILGLQKPTKGEIFLDDIKLNSFDLNYYRKKIGFVSQDPFLFYDTIRNNLLWSIDKVSENEILESLKLANIHDFVMNLPLKIDTYVGERGLELSGGERQRIVLARAIIRKPKILILDEATSALDQNSEKMINNTLKEISKFTTVLVVAHRSSTIKIADKIYVLKNGIIVEDGTYEKLIQSKNNEFSKIMNE
tara:strand:+ start:2371 stop:4131 length:1761 start_codon:yes stop_codon:yes gene_type:complete